MHGATIKIIILWCFTCNYHVLCYIRWVPVLQKMMVFCSKRRSGRFRRRTGTHLSIRRVYAFYTTTNKVISSTNFKWNTDVICNCRGFRIRCKSSYELLHVRLSVSPHTVRQLGSIWTDFRKICYWRLVWKSVNKVLIWLQLDKNI